MEPIYINKPIEVVATFNFKDTKSICLPVKIKYQNKITELTELGLRHPTKKGNRSIHIFDMSDGNNDYRLEFDSETLIWKLIYITNFNYHA